MPGHLSCRTEAPRATRAHIVLKLHTSSNTPLNWSACLLCSCRVCRGYAAKAGAGVAKARASLGDISAMQSLSHGARCGNPREFVNEERAEFLYA
jgi:hypothetical protein